MPPAAPPAGGTLPMGPDPVSSADLSSPVPTASVGEVPVLIGAGLGDLWRGASEPPAGLPTGERYRVGEILGVGATARVYAVHDRNLERTVAVKVLFDALEPQRVTNFVAEARLMALLDHPNVLPVHEAAFTADGSPYFAMKRIAGTTLGEALAAAAEGRPSPRVVGAGAAVAILIDVAKAVSYAHHRGVVHQDIKPDNILLGNFGEVLLLDWGSALTLQPGGRWVGGIYGTPLYMAPEQARREQVGPSADIYALGGTLFHALLGRVPCWSSDPDAFWRMRTSGEIQPPTAAERQRVPAPLLSIAMTALAARPEDRYRTADDFLRDLQGYQAGLAVAAHRDSLWQFLRRWAWAHRQWLAAALGVAAALTLAALVWYRAWLREQSSWSLVLQEDFDRPASALAADWRMEQRSVLAEGKPFTEAALGAVHGWGLGPAGMACNPFQSVAELSCRRSFPGNLRVEWDERSPDSGRNLNCFLGSDRVSGYTFHVGGWSDPTLVVLTRGPTYARLAWTHVPALRPDRTYHFALEHVGRHIRLAIDGIVAIDYQGLGGMDAPDRPTFGFDALNERLELGHVRVYSQRPPQLVSPLAVPDDHFRVDDYAEALSGYRAIAAAYPGTDLAARARFGAGLSLARSGHAADAAAMLESFERAHPTHEDVPFALWERLHLAVQQGDAAAEERLRQELARFRGHPVLPAVLNELSEERCALLAFQPVRAIGDLAIAPDAITRVEAAFDELARWSRSYGVPCLNTRLFTDGTLWLIELGADRYVAERLANLDDLCLQSSRMEALNDLGEFAAMQAVPHASPDWLARMLCEQTRFDEVPQMLPAGSREYVPLAPDRALEARQAQLEAVGPDALAAWVAKTQAQARIWALGGVDRPGTSPHDLAIMLATLGRDDEVIARCPDEPGAVAVAALHRLAAGQTAQGAAVIRASARMTWILRNFESDPGQQVDLAAAHYLLPALLALDEGGTVDLSAIDPVIKDRCQKQLWYMVRFMRGDIDESDFRAQPERLMVSSRLALAMGLRAEMQHQPAAALAAYRKVMPPAWEPDILAHIAQWRRMRLGDPR